MKRLEYEIFARNMCMYILYAREERNLFLRLDLWIIMLLYISTQKNLFTDLKKKNIYIYIFLYIYIYIYIYIYK